MKLKALHCKKLQNKNRNFTKVSHYKRNKKKKIKSKVQAKNKTKLKTYKTKIKKIVIYKN